MNGAGTLAVQAALGLVPILVALVAYRQAVKANAITAGQAERQARRSAELERSKVDAEAYNRAKAIYEAALDQLEKQLDRLQGQSDRLSEQLSREQDTSNTLRTQVSILQSQVREMDRTMSALRRQLIAAGVNPAAIPPPLSPPPRGEE